MIGKVTKIFKDKRYGFIQNTTNDEYSFKFGDFRFEKDILNLERYDEVRFYEDKNYNSKNRSALSIYKIIRVKDISTKYNIDEEDIIEEARRQGETSVKNRYSYMGTLEAEQIINTIKGKSVNKKTIACNLPRPKNNFFHSRQISKTTPVRSNSFSIVDYIKEKYLIFVDTSSLMQYNMLNALNNEVIPYLKKYDQKLYVVDSVEHEINKLLKTKGNENPSSYKQAKSARFILNVLSKDDLYVIPETNASNRKFADEELISCFTNYRTKYNLCLITNDNSQRKDGNLAGSILRLKHEQPIRGIKDIKVFSVSRDDGDFRFIEFKDETIYNSFYITNKPPKRVSL